MFLVRRGVAHDDARQAVIALKPHDPVAEHRGIEQHGAGTVRDEVLPMCAARIRQRREHDLEVFAVVGVGLDDELRLAAERRMMLDAIADARLARLDDQRFRERFGEIEQPRLGGFAVAANDDAVHLGLQLADTDEKTLVGFFIDKLSALCLVPIA